MRWTSLLPLFLAFPSLSLPSSAHPTRTIAGVPVIDTPLIRAAQAYAQRTVPPFVYAHVLRSWLFGALLISHNATLQSTVDLEVHALASILHDLGWSRDAESGIVSTDKRFEVDGAIAARAFIERYGVSAEWDDDRVQLVWDAVALHTTTSIAMWKEGEVAVTAAGIGMDFAGVTGGVTEVEYERVVREFGREGFREGVNESFVWLCGMKPRTTYDTFMQPFGERYVEGYEAVGSRFIDRLGRLEE